MPESYWLDANVLIESAKGAYGFDIAPAFWSNLDAKAREGLVRSSTMVYNEIAQGRDDLVVWVQAHRQLLFVEPDEGVQRAFSEIAIRVKDQHS